MISISGYSALERIGHGGLGDVYRATRDSTGGTVAVKVLRDVSDESVAWHRTRRELTALRSLSGHANVIQLIELLDLPEGPALVMEFAPGGSVADLLARRDGPLTVGEAVFVGRQIASALVAAHEQGIVHRDVKPQNLLIDAYGQVKLCDFGIAAIARTEEFRTRTSALSMRYASPEDLDNEVDLGPSSDVYSLGATLLHVARGAPPTMKERLMPWVPPPAAHGDQAQLDAIIARCLRPEAVERPTAAEVFEDLERLGWSIDERHRSLVLDGEPAPEANAATTARRPAAPPVVGPASGPIVAASSEEETVVRPGGTPRPHPESEPLPETVERHVRRPRPSTSSPRRRRALLAGAIAALVAGAIVVWPDGSADAPTVVDRPTNLLPIDDASIVWPPGDVGDCVVQVEGADQLEPVECDEPHDLQRILNGTLDEFPNDAEFDEVAVRSAVQAACVSAFERIVGIPLAESELSAPFTAPSAATFADGDRSFQCLVGLADRRLRGDVTDSRR